MFRTIAAAAFILATATAAHAGDTAKADLYIAYDQTLLSTESGRDQVKRDADKAIEAYCRANPVEGTVADCRAALGAQAAKQIEGNAVTYASMKGQIQLSRAPRR